MFIPALSASAAAVCCAINVQCQIRFLVAVYATAVVVQSARQGSALWGIANEQGRAHLSRPLWDADSALTCSRLQLLKPKPRFSPAFFRDSLLPGVVFRAYRSRELQGVGIIRFSCFVRWPGISVGRFFLTLAR